MVWAIEGGGGGEDVCVVAFAREQLSSYHVNGDVVIVVELYFCDGDAMKVSKRSRLVDIDGTC